MAEQRRPPPSMKMGSREMFGEHLAALLDNPRLRRWDTSHQWREIETIYSSPRFLRTSPLALEGVGARRQATEGDG